MTESAGPGRQQIYRYDVGERMLRAAMILFGAVGIAIGVGLVVSFVPLAREVYVAAGVAGVALAMYDATRTFTARIVTDSHLDQLTIYSTFVTRDVEIGQVRTVRVWDGLRHPILIFRMVDGQVIRTAACHPSQLESEFPDLRYSPEH